MLANVQSLRGIAAVMVVYYHAHGALIKRAAELNLTSSFWTQEQGITKFGALGVDIFFVISGFIIFHSTWDKTLSSRQFIMARTRRIYPLYWVASLFFIALTLLPGTSYQLGTQEIIFSLLLIPAYFNGDVKPVLEVGWSLYYEMFFYLLFAALIWQTRKVILLQLTGLFCFLVIVGSVFHTDAAIWKVITNDRLLEFIAGGWAALVYRSRTAMPWNSYKRWAALFVIASFGLAFVAADGWREDYSALITRGPIALALFSLFLFDDKWKPLISGRLMSFLGDASYSIYLFHMFPLMIVSGIWKRGLAISPFHGLVTWGILITLGVAAGIVAHVLIEKPLMAYLRDKKLRRPYLPVR